MPPIPKLGIEPEPPPNKLINLPFPPLWKSENRPPSPPSNPKVCCEKGIKDKRKRDSKPKFLGAIPQIRWKILIGLSRVF